MATPNPPAPINAAIAVTDNVITKDKEPDENHRAESIQVKNVVFKADKNLKKRISAAGFEKYNPKKHNKRKY